MVSVLITGGAGYIGSHAAKAVARAGMTPVVYDDLSSGRPEAVQWGPLEIGDIGDKNRLAEVLARHRPVAVMHFAGRIYVGESTSDPLAYYITNVSGTAALLDAMRAADVRFLVFSSSCAVYGLPERMPLAEDAPLAPVNPYGMSKLMAERMIADCDAAYGLKTATLRYFNAAGADPEGDIGENHDPEPHLIPRALMVAAGILPSLEIHGTDYATGDGTCVRDFIHVSDLAAAHVAALAEIRETGRSVTLNLGTGRGYSVRELVAAVTRVTGRRIPIVEGARRPGDSPVLVADASQAGALGLLPNLRTLDEIIATAWRWEQSGRPARKSVAP